VTSQTTIVRNTKLQSRDRVDQRFPKLHGSLAPYHIINAAVNLQGSAEANRRGRNADFFIFTPKFIGSDLTLFTRSRVLEKLDRRIDVATAMAVSGAAVSANMGSETVRVLLAP
jgi:hypothetical protein